jgi:hypothetical protein
VASEVVPQQRERNDERQELSAVSIDDLLKLGSAVCVDVVFEVPREVLQHVGVAAG